MHDSHVFRWMRHLEAREWLARIRAKRPRNYSEGAALLDQLIADIAKRRSPAAAQELRELIEVEQKKPR